MQVGKINYLAYSIKCDCLGTFSSRHVYPQSGECRETRVSRDGVFSAQVAGGCSDTVALIARRYDLDTDTP